jgi:Uma2 family endonuclease
MTYDEYLAYERASDTKHEFVRGEVFAMSGAKLAHNEIARNILGSLHAQLRGRRCRPYGSDMRVRTRDDVGTYPDISVFCGKLELTDGHEDELRNPTVIIEILSDSTEAYDRGEKFEHYRTIESLREYVLASTKSARVDHFVRGEDGEWKLRSYGAGQSFTLPSIECTLAVDEVYELAFDDAG